jgi:hypothetical protein
MTIRSKFVALSFAGAVCASQMLSAETMVEAKAAYFNPTSSSFRSVYSGGGMYSLEATARAWRQFYGWGSVGYFGRNGSSVGLGNSAHIQMVPFGIGAKYIACCDCIKPYIGLGMLVTYVNLHNDSPFVTHKQHKWGVGGIVKGGLLIDLPCCWFADLFADYNYTKVHFSSGTANISGYSAGVGLGYKF